jgi:cation:H+ antiporter
MIFTVLLFLLGAATLYAGAEGLVRGSINLARLYGIRPFIIGLTVVAFGTSAPEFLVSFISAFKGNSDIALGNVVGSNIANIGLILGIAAVLRPIDVDKNDLLVHYPVMFGASVSFALFALADRIVFVHGLILLCGIAIYTYFLIRRTKRLFTGYSVVASAGRTPVPQKGRQVAGASVLIVLGSLLLLLGSDILVKSGIAIAEGFGIPEFVIGSTIIAVGTSLPELAATVIAVIKRNTGMCLGNVIGSNIYNVLFVIGGVSVILPISVLASSRLYEFPVMLIFSVVLFIFMRTGLRVNRGEGIILLTGYILFIYKLF